MWRFLVAISTIFFVIITYSLYQSGGTTTTNGVKVIVVGAGVAGLAAASKLHNEGFEVVQLEAQDHIGANGQYFEEGAEWIHGEKNNSIFELVQPLGLVNPPPTDHSVSCTGPPGLVQWSDDRTTRVTVEWIEQAFLSMGVFASKGAYSKYRIRGQIALELALDTGEHLNKSMCNELEKVLEYMNMDPEQWASHLRNASLGEFAKFVLQKYNKTYPFTSDESFLNAVYDWGHRCSSSWEGSDNWFEKSISHKGEQYVELEGSAQVTWKTPYSYSSLHQLILTGGVTENGSYPLPEWIKLNSVVKNIQYSTDSDTVKVILTDGTEYTTDHLVFTPSLGVLKAKHEELFSPHLPPKKKLTIENIGFGSETKLAYEFDPPWWTTSYRGVFPLWTDRNYYDAENQQEFSYWRNDITKEELLRETDGVPLWIRSICNIFTVHSGAAPNILRVWLSGMPSRILDELEPDYIEKHVMNFIHKFLDKRFPNITNPVRAYQTKWWSNPYIRGGYGYRTLDSEDKNVWARDLAEPILQLGTMKPLICFAGEATHPTYFATVHGAYDTGVREFERIRDFHKH